MSDLDFFDLLQYSKQYTSNDSDSCYSEEELNEINFCSSSTNSDSNEDLEYFGDKTEIGSEQISNLNKNKQNVEEEEEGGEDGGKTREKSKKRKKKRINKEPGEGREKEAVGGYNEKKRKESKINEKRKDETKMSTRKNLSRPEKIRYDSTPLLLSLKKEENTNDKDRQVKQKKKIKKKSKRFENLPFNDRTSKQIMPITALDGNYNYFKIKIVSTEAGMSGMKRAIYYEIKTKKACQFVSSTHTTSMIDDFSVKRRYRDFIWFKNKLQELFPGVIFPPLPQKPMITRKIENFLEKKTKKLEQFLKYIYRHPLLSTSPLFKLFFEEELSNISQISNSEKNRLNGILLLPKKFNEYQCTKKDSKYIDNTLKTWKKLKPLLKIISNQSKKLKKVEKKQINQFNQLSLTLDKLKTIGRKKKFHKTCDIISNQMARLKKIKTVIVKISYTKLDHSLDLCVRLTESIESTEICIKKKFLKLKHSKKKKKDILQKIVKSKLNQNPNLPILQEKLSKNNEIINLLENQSQKIKGVFVKELQNMEIEKHKLFKKIFMNFCTVQHNHSIKIQNSWTNVIERLEKIQIH
ncbi:sorting nexin [Anaeramoeba flamelloides]|uniref:Sorting nexin n=1 Tax=Anaeramoeba flamelloides TaxID=1746091 RepID=A0AAV7YJQ1_9EUKA|nr:sorting nexin [Anaeramoeba flamelloides]